MANIAQNTTGVGGGVLLAPLIVFFWNYLNPTYPMDAVVASTIGGIIGTFFGSLLPELWGMFKARFNPRPPDPVPVTIVSRTTEGPSP